MAIDVLENSKSETEIYPFEMGYLPDRFKKKAELELKDTPENRERGLQQLKDMMKDDKIFELRKFDEDFLLQYLLSRKFNLSHVLKQLRALINLSRKCPYVFTDIKFENLAISTRNKIVTFLPWRCPEGCAIIIVKVGNWDPEEFPVDEIKRMAVIYLLVAMRDPMTQVNGFKIIFDVKSNPLKHVKYATPSNMHLLYHGPVECSAGRFKAIHVLNESLTFKVAYFLIKPFLSHKMRQRIILHSKAKDLLKFFPAAVIPEEYGGTLKDYDMTSWLKNALHPDSLACLAGWDKPC